jgi:hypothetical protein
VASYTGEISGTLSVPLQAIPIRAVSTSDGASYSTQTIVGGKFAFANLPISEYRVLADERTLAQSGYEGSFQTIDLAPKYSASTTIPLVPTTRGVNLQGTINDERGALLPFGWVTIERAGLSEAIAPDSGAYALYDLPRQAVTLVASAPGHYSEARAIDLSSTEPASFMLTRRHETGKVAWGRGEVVIPPESSARDVDQSIVLEYGWLWGSGDSRPLAIRLPEMTITIPSGAFAIAYFPDRGSWLYLTQGEAEVRSTRRDGVVAVHAGEMLALSNVARLKVVRLDPVVISVLDVNNTSPVAPVWEQNPSARLRDALAQAGINLAQVATFATYLFVVGALILAPLWVIIMIVRQRRRNNTTRSES